MSAPRDATIFERSLGVDPGNATKLLALAASFGIVFLARNALGYLGPFIAQDLDLANERIGLLAAAFSLTWAISGFVITALTRDGAQRAWLAGLMIALGLASAASGLASAFLLLVLARLAGGVVSGPVLPLTQSFAAPIGPESRRGLRMGVIQGLGGGLIGAVAAPLLLVPVAENRGWRSAFLLIAVIAIACAGFLWRVLPRTFARAEERSSDVRSGVAVSLPVNIVVCCLISGAMVGWLILTLTFFPLYLVRVAHFALPDMGTVMSLMGIGTVVAGFLVPFLSDRFGRRRILIIFAFIGVVSPLAVMLVRDSWPGLAACVLLGSLAGGTFPLFMAVIPSVSVTPARLAMSISIVQGAGEVVGGVIAPVAGGWAADRFGLEAPLVLAQVLAMLGGGMAFAISERSTPHPQLS